MVCASVALNNKPELHSPELKAAFPVAAEPTDLAAQLWLCQQAPRLEWPGSRELELAEFPIGGEPVPLCSRHRLSLSERSKLPVLEHIAAKNTDLRLTNCLGLPGTGSVSILIPENLYCIK